MPLDVMSDDEFLKRTGAAHSAADDDTAFLVRTGAAVPKLAPVTPSAPGELPGGMRSSAQPIPSLPRGTAGLDQEMPTLAGSVPSAAPGTLRPGGFIGQAETENALSVPQGRHNMMFLPWTADEGTGANGNISLPGFIRAPLQGAVQGPSGVTIDPNTNTLGATPELTAAASLGASPFRLGSPSGLSFVPQGALNPRAPLSQEFAANPLATDLSTRLVAPEEGNTLAVGPASPTGIAPSRAADIPPPAVSVPVPQNDAAWARGVRDSVQAVMDENRAMGVPASVGAAATPGQLSNLSPAQMKAYRRVSELNDILRPPGEADAVIHVKGSEPTLAERSADPNIAQQETLLRFKKPDAFDGPGGRLTKNTQARVQHFDDLAGTDVQRQMLDDAQAAQAQADTAQIKRLAKPANLQPVVDHVDSLLNDPRIQEREDVVKVLRPLRDSLYDADGNLKTDPNSVWGMHDNVMYKLTKAKDPLNAAGSEKFAFDQLLSFKKALDGVLNTATDGHFQTFLDNQASFFQQKNALKLLQDFRPKLTNAQGNINTAAYHKWVLDLAIRRGKPGVDPAMDIPDSTMQGLISLDNDLKRATNIDLGKARGSPTNLFFELAHAMGITAAHGAMALSPVGGVGNFVLQSAGGAAANKFRNIRLNKGVERHLAPPPDGYQPNPLSAPMGP